jgi:hypothetical protein
MGLHSRDLEGAEGKGKQTAIPVPFLQAEGVVFPLTS